MLSDPEYFKKLLTELSTLSPFVLLIVLSTLWFGFQTLNHLVLSFGKWIMKKTSSFHLFIINGTSKMIAPKLSPLKMPNDPEKSLFFIMWLLIWANASALHLNLFCAINMRLRIITCFTFIISYIVLRICNYFINDDEQQPPIKEDDFWDNLFKVLKFT